MIKKYNLSPQILHDKEEIDKSADIILINTFGELEKYYNYCKIVFVGKSLLKSFYKFLYFNYLTCLKIFNQFTEIKKEKEKCRKESNTLR